MCVTVLFETVLYILTCNEIIIFSMFKISQSVQGLFTATVTEVECCGRVLTFVFAAMFSAVGGALS
jgi:hypothetical protein